MLDLPENELFSAYIDGELTADEQAEVEQILNDNPEARQLVDDLRSLSSSLQALPAYKLDQDLVSRVLRQAEREMLAEPAAPLPKFHQVDLPADKPVSWTRRLLRPRNFAWSAVAIAVALILAINEPGREDGPAGTIAQRPGSRTIEPLDIDLTVEAVESPPAATIVQNSEPKKEAVEVAPAPSLVEPSPAPTAIAEKTPDTEPDSDRPGEPAADKSPLLVLQCQLAEGRVGHEALARLLKEAGVDVGEPIRKGEGEVEFTLTTDQVRQVVVRLQDAKDFSSFSFLNTPKTAPPRIPSALAPGSLHSEEATSSAGIDAKTPPAATFRVQGTITVQPKAAPATAPSETTGADDGSTRAKVTAKAVPLKKPKAVPVDDDSVYRVRFLIKPSEKAVPGEGSAKE